MRCRWTRSQVWVTTMHALEITTSFVIPLPPSKLYLQSFPIIIELRHTRRKNNPRYFVWHHRHTDVSLTEKGAPLMKVQGSGVAVVMILCLSNHYARLQQAFYKDAHILCSSILYTSMLCCRWMHQQGWGGWIQGCGGQLGVSWTTCSSTQKRPKSWWWIWGEPGNQWPQFPPWGIMLTSLNTTNICVHPQD